MKQVIIKCYSGLGNKLFDSLYALYINDVLNKNKKQVEVLLHYQKNGHDKKQIEIYKIFPKIYDTIRIINDTEYEKLISNEKFIIKLRKYKSITKEDFSDIKEYIEKKLKSKDVLNFDPYIFYKDIDKVIIYLRKNIDLDSYINIDRKFLNKDIINLVNSKNKICVVHIRYNDFISCILGSLKNKNKYNKDHLYFITMSPDYYVDSIKKIKNKYDKIILISDSPKDVKRLIIPKLNELNIKYIDKTNIDRINSLYLLMNSDYNIMSKSTFSIGGTLLNKNNKGLIYNNPLILKVGEVKINPKTWDYTKDKKYALNYDRDYVLNNFTNQ